jgi:hypothetical protein
MGSVAMRRAGLTAAMPITTAVVIPAVTVELSVARGR